MSPSAPSAAYAAESSPTADPPALPPPLDDFHRQIRAVVDDCASLVDGLDAEAFNWAPDTRSWSIGQCLQHLNTVNRAYGRRLERRLESEVARGASKGDVPWRPGLLERLAIHSMEPPPRLRLPAPRSVVPPSELDLETVVDAFRVEHARLARLVEEARGLDLRKTKVSSPLAPGLRISAGAAFGFLAAHDRRHLWQAWNVRRHPSFSG